MRFNFAVTILAVLCISALYSQDDYTVLLYDGPSHLMDQSKVVLLDASGNIYVTGSSFSSANKEDYVTIKYNTLGLVQWVARYDGPGHDIDVSNAMVVDGSGNVYVTGKSRQTTSANTEEYCTIKYNSAGVQQWVARYDSPQLCNYTYNEALAIDVDATGNVYITGDTRNTTYLDDITTIKYSPTGTQLWLMRYNYSSNKEDIGKFLKVDRASGNVFVGGISKRTNFGFDYLLIKYNSAGAQQWVTRYNGPGNGDDIANGMAMDNGGNIFLTGSSKSTGPNTDIATLKINGITGDSMWIVRFVNPAGSGEGRAIVVDDYGSAYMAGAMMGAQTNYDFVTIKYDAIGNQLWLNRYDGPANGLDKPSDIKLRKIPCGPGLDNPCYRFNVYVTGSSAGLGTLNDYTTIKYDEKGLLQWVKRYNGAGNSDDQAASIAINGANEFIFVTGTSHNDYATVWYVPNTGISINRVTENIPSEFSLVQNYPNPFNPSTSIVYNLPVTSEVKLIIYDATGRTIETAVNGIMEAGTHSVTWDASNYNSGVYFYKLQAGSFTETRRMVLLK